MRDLDPKELLYLAAMTYSGFSALVPAGIDPSHLTAAIERGLARAPVHGKWKLAWGPASFRARLSLFDDAAMYVLRSTGERRRYVVAIRGTNPVSGFDWIFGDLWVSQLENEVELQNRLASGHDLVSFLRAAVREAGDRPVDVVVTGHSKGGALATAAALWLHETRGDGVAEEERGDPGQQATVSCAAFAGLTAGNRGFAKRVEDKLGANYRRIANSLDIVPSAFVPEKLDRLARLYGPAVQSIAGMKQFAALIAAEIGPLEYTHAFPTPGRQLTEIAGEVEPSKRLYVEQAIYEHLDGYLDGVGLSPPMTAWTFFNSA